MGDIKIIHINGKLTNAEHETLLNYSVVDKIWTMDTMVMKHYNRAKKQHWKQMIEYRYDDESVCGGVFEAPSRAITIRSTDKKQMSKKQLMNLSGDEDDDEE